MCRERYSVYNTEPQKLGPFISTAVHKECSASRWLTSHAIGKHLLLELVMINHHGSHGWGRGKGVASGNHDVNLQASPVIGLQAQHSRGHLKTSEQQEFNLYQPHINCKTTNVGKLELAGKDKVGASK